MDFIAMFLMHCRLVVILQQSSPLNLSLVNYLYHRNKHCIVIYTTTNDEQTVSLIINSTVAYFYCFDFILPLFQFSTVS